jgi:hypothetical protein
VFLLLTLLLLLLIEDGVSAVSSSLAMYIIKATCCRGDVDVTVVTTALGAAVVGVVEKELTDDIVMVVKATTAAKVDVGNLILEC